MNCKLREDKTVTLPTKLRPQYYAVFLNNGNKLQAQLGLFVDPSFQFYINKIKYFTEHQQLIQTP
jgi:hypothetical protein